MVAEPDHDQKVELNFWVMPNAEFATRGILQRFINDFEKINPNVTVKLSIHPWSVSWQRLMDMIKGQNAGPKPDILQMGTTHVGTLAFLGALEKIPDASVLPEEDRMSAYIWDPGAITEGDQDLYCVPWFIDIRVLYYRRDIFELLGLDPDMLQDWKGFFQACIEIQKSLRKGNLPQKITATLGIPGQKPGVLMHDLAPWMWASGGDFCSEDLTEAIFDSDSSIRGCEFYFDLINQGFMPLPTNSYRQGNFFTGNTVMQITGAWPGATYLNMDWEYATREVVEGFAVTFFPSGPEGRFTFLGGSNLGVTAFSEKKEMAWKFLRFLSEPERQVQHAKSIGALTARLASMDDLFKGQPDARKVFWDSFGHARRLPRLVELGSVEQIVTSMGNQILNLIRRSEYNHKHLHHEMGLANEGIKTVLSLHRHGGQSGELAA